MNFAYHKIQKLSEFSINSFAKMLETLILHSKSVLHFNGPNGIFTKN